MTIATPPYLLFAPRHTRELGERVAAALGIALAASEEREFDGGEHKMRALEDVMGLHVFVVQSLNGDAHSSANDKLCRLLFFIAALKDAGAASVTACVPYLCYSRKDRRTQPHDPVTTRYVGTLFEAVGVDRVVVLDVHNEAAFDNAFRCKTLRLDAAPVFASQLAALVDPSRCVVASPDVGGVKRAQLMREGLASTFGSNIGFAFMEKRRASGVVSGDAFIGAVDGADVILYDDMVVSGHTIGRAASAARAAGARKIVVAAAHAAFTEAAMHLFEPGGPNAVLVSDSVALAPAFARVLGGKLQVCSCAPVIASTIADLARHPA